MTHLLWLIPVFFDYDSPPLAHTCLFLSLIDMNMICLLANMFLATLVSLFQLNKENPYNTSSASFFLNTYRVLSYTEELSF